MYINSSLYIKNVVDIKYHALGKDCIFHGLVIGNKENPNFFMTRRTANISRVFVQTKLNMKIPLRWWSVEARGVDKLFDNDGVILPRSEAAITCGADELLLVYYEILGESKSFFFEPNTVFGKVDGSVKHVLRNGLIIIDAPTDRATIKYPLGKVV
jgi:hypothetical protein